MIIDKDGNVGIGDTSPFAKLHVEDTGWSSGAPYGTVAYIQGGATNDANWGHLLLSQSGTTTDTGGRLAFGANGENPIAGIRAKYKGATYGDLAFSTRPSGGTNTERMVIDSSGNVGIGIAAENAYSSYTALEISRSGSIYANNSADDFNIGNNFYLGSGGNWKAKNTEAAALMQFDNGIFNFFTAASTTADSNINWTQIAEITTTGQINATAGAVSAPTYSFINDKNTGMTRPTTDTIQFVNGGSESARINSSRQFMIGLTAAGDGGHLSVLSNGGEGIFNGVDSTNAYRRYYHTVSDGIHRFKGSANTATITNAGAWQDASDVAYKEDIQDISYGLDAVKALRPRKYKMKGTDLGNGEGLDQKIGFIAQEAELVVPEVVDGTDGEKTLGYGQLTAVLTKAIQEQQTIIEDLKARIETLEE